MRTPRNLFLLAAVFVVAGAIHFVSPERYVAIMPQWAPRPLTLVYLSGVFEILGGIALLVSSLRRLAGFGLIALLVAVFPANIQMLANAVADGKPAYYLALLWLRLPLQPLLIVWIWKATQAARR